MTEKSKKMLSTFINRHGPSHRFYISRAKEILPEPATDIKIYSNCDHIHLKVNGQDCGHPDREDNILIWKNVSLKKGENRIEASGKKGTVELTDQCKWVLLDKKK